MLADDYRSHFRSDADRLLTAAASGFELSVPMCPDWTVADVVGHIGRIHHWVAGVIEFGSEAPAPSAAPSESGELLAWARQGSEALQVKLDHLDPGDVCWSWVPSHQTGAFWLRRMAQEVAVHRFDVENAHGTPKPIEPELAVDGIEEFCELWLVLAAERAAPSDVLLADGRSIHLHATDTAGEWVLTADPVALGGVRVERAHGKATFAVRGTANDLLLLLWGRRDLVGDAGLFETFGDREVFDRLLTLVKI